MNLTLESLWYLNQDYKTLYCVTKGVLHIPDSHAYELSGPAAVEVLHDRQSVHSLL